MVIKRSGPLRATHFKKKTGFETGLVKLATNQISANNLTPVHYLKKSDLPLILGAYNMCAKTLNWKKFEKNLGGWVVRWWAYLQFRTFGTWNVSTKHKETPKKIVGYLFKILCLVS